VSTVHPAPLGACPKRSTSPAADASSPLQRACATRIVALVPGWMREIRAEMRAQAPQGLSVPLFRALIFTRVQPGASVSELALHLGVAVPTASVAVEKLVAAGFLESRAAPANRRRRALHLTADGATAVARAMEHTIAVFAGRLQPLDDDALTRILGAFDQLEQALAHPSRPSPP